MSSRLAFVILFAVAISAAAQQPVQPGAQPFERPVITSGAGAHKLRVDVPLLTGAQRFASLTTDAAGSQATGGLADLRLFDSDGRELAYLLVSPPRPRPSWVAGELLAIAPTKKTSGFEVDLGEARLVDMLLVDGLPVPFLKRLVLEGSGDRAHWTMLVSEGTLFDLPQERVRQTSVAFMPGTYRYLRVTWDDTNSGVLPMPRRVSAREATALTPPIPLRSPVTIERQASEPGRSRYRLRLPGAGLPVVALVLDAGRGDVFRTATVIESRFNGVRADPVELGRTRLVRTAQDRETAPTLRLPIDPPRGAELQLVIDDANNPPLDLKSVAVEFAELPWIYFEAPTGSVTARYGSPRASAPLYDLEAKRPTLHLATVNEASWGEPRPTTGTASAIPSPSLPDRGAKIDTAGFTYRRALPEGARGLVALQLDAPVLSHSNGPDAAFADVRIVDDGGNQIPYLVERRDEPLSLDLTIRPAGGDIPVLRRDRGSANRSVYAIALPYSNLPGQRLVIGTSDRVFRRPIEVGMERRPDRQHRDSWFDTLATRVWQHADQSTTAPPLDLPIRARDVTELLLIVEEGDNRALPITGARLLLPSWRLRFFRPAEPLQLIYGRRDARPPEYDLALLAPAVMGADVTEITAAPEAAGGPVPAAVLTPRVFWIGLGVAVLVLLALIARLISSTTK